MNASDLKEKILHQLDTFDNSPLEEFYGIMQNFINSNKTIDDWTDLPDDKKDIEAAITELNSGKGIPHSQVMDKFRKKYSIKISRPTRILR